MVDKMPNLTNQFMEVVVFVKRWGILNIENTNPHFRGVLEFWGLNPQPFSRAGQKILLENQRYFG
jgi:hypothetical protein